jgi:uncharacterized protein
VKEIFVLDACALIAFFDDEVGADKVEDIIQKAKNKECIVYMNKLNLLEIYYGVYRDDGKIKAEATLTIALNLPLKVIDGIDDNIFMEAGRYKAKYKISLADSIALAEAKVRNAILVTADHHEFDIIDKDGEVKFYWIR